MEEMRNTDIEANGEDLLTGAFITAIVYVSGILIPMIISICYVVKCRTHCCLKVTVYLQLAIEFCLALVIMILAFESSRMYRTYSEQVIRLDEAVQGCMDQYSDIPDYVVKDLLVQPTEDGKTAATILGVFGALVFFKIIVVAIHGLYIKCSAGKK